MSKKFFGRFLVVCIVAILLVGILGGCGQKPQPPATPGEPAPKKYVIGFSNSGVSNSWAAAYFRAAVNALGELDNVKFYTADGNDTVAKQIADVEDLLAKNIDLLMIRPENPEALSSVVEKAFNSGIPVVVTGRSIATDKYTTFVMLDDKELGRKAAEHAVKLLTEKFGEPKGKVFELQGNMAAGSARGRNAGITEVFSKYPNIEVVAQQPANYQRAMGKSVMENVLQAHPQLDLIISHSGESLAGAIEAIEAAGRMGEAFLVGIDGYNGLLKAIKAGKAHYTVLYPVELGAESVRVAMKILQGEQVPKLWPMPIFEVFPDNVDQYVDMNAPDSAWTF